MSAPQVYLCTVVLASACAATLFGQDAPHPNSLMVLSSNATPPTVGMEGKLEVILPVCSDNTSGGHQIPRHFRQVAAHDGKFLRDKSNRSGPYIIWLYY